MTNKEKTVIVTLQHEGVVKDLAWIEATADESKKDKLIGGGYLFGDQKLVGEVEEALYGSPDYIKPPAEFAYVKWSTYNFTDFRDEPADIVAAMLHVAGERAFLNDTGWAILEEAMPELTDPENNREDNIY